MIASTASFLHCRALNVIVSCTSYSDSMFSTFQKQGPSVACQMEITNTYFCTVVSIKLHFANLLNCYRS